MRRDPQALHGQSFDVAIVGGGMHGAWIALRAARAGCRVALLERDDFGSGTSANSLKILHGGLRYLQHLDLPRMRRSIAARRAHARWFPHLFEALPCVMPLQAGGLRSPWLLGPALLANEVIAADRNAGVAPASRLPAGRLLSGARCASELASLVRCQPLAGALWWDGIARDAERLVLEVVLAAARAGAVVANHASVERIVHAGGQVRGVAWTDRLTGRSHELSARSVVNAAGPWAAELARASGLPVDALPAAWTGALNVVLRRPLGNAMAVALTTAGRELFFVPWQGRTMIGTAYCPVPSLQEGTRGPPAPAVHRFIAQAAALAPEAGIEMADIARIHWGLLPLRRAGDALPRKSPLLLMDAAQTGAKGLLVVIGEKLTSAPEVSRVVVRALVARDGGSTDEISGDAGVRREVPDVALLPEAARARLAMRFGRRWTEVARMGIEHGEKYFEPLIAGSPVLLVELLHAVHAEMAQNLSDLLRRAGLGQAGHPGAPMIDACAQWAIEHAGWDAAHTRREAREIDAWFAGRCVSHETLPAGPLGLPGEQPGQPA